MTAARTKPTVVRLHRGDIMSPEKRSALMARIRGRDTGPERVVAAALRALAVKFESHAKDLPGRPDFVFRTAKVAVFVDGTFWHGWGFKRWRNKLTAHWEHKIASNIQRDRRNHRRLRRMGWRVVRLWEHQIEKDPDACISRIVALLGSQKPPPRARRSLIV